MTEENNIVTVEQDVELTAGEMLKNARTMGRRRREIPTIAKGLCIREEFLEALEAGNYTVIPEVVYILGFARNYAMELGLDPDVIVAKIKRELGLEPDMAAAATDDERNSIESARTGNGLKFLKSGLFERCRNFVVHNWKWVVGAIAALIVIIVASLLIFGGNSVPVADDATDAAVVTTAEVAANTISEPEYNVKVRERFDVENAKTGNVVIQATTESWVKIEDARGKTVFSRVLLPGDVYFMPAGDKYKGTFGNAGGIDVWVNGELAPVVGAAHTRVTGVSLAPDSLMKKKAEKTE